MNGAADTPVLTVVDAFPAELLHLEATELHENLGAPTLIRCGDENARNVTFISVLLHGNETSGWDAIRRFIATRGLPSDHKPHQRVLFFLGNLRAAAANARTLPDQEDFNRIWDGATNGLAQALTDQLRDERITVAIDLHNNTGRNPPFAVVTNTHPATLDLASDFSPRVVLVESPSSVLTRLFDDRCPAMAVELGAVGDPECIGRAEALLAGILDSTSPNREARRTPTIYRAVARVFVNPDIEFSIGPAEDVDLILSPDLEDHNFGVLEKGYVLGHAARVAFRVEAADGTDVTDHFVEQSGSVVRLKQRIIPAMSTSDIQGIRLDCLCYLMEELDVR